MPNFVELTSTSNSNSKLFVNIDTISYMQKFENYTHIYFNFSITGPNGGYVQFISILETPAQILALLT